MSSVLIGALFWCAGIHELDSMCFPTCLALCFCRVCLKKKIPILTKENHVNSTRIRIRQNNRITIKNWFSSLIEGQRHFPKIPAGDFAGDGFHLMGRYNFLFNLSGLIQKVLRESPVLCKWRSVSSGWSRAVRAGGRPLLIARGPATSRFSLHILKAKLRSS